jgi:hypothetical protein
MRCLVWVVAFLALNENSVAAISGKTKKAVAPRRTM